MRTLVLRYNYKKEKHANIANLLKCYFSTKSSKEQFAGTDITPLALSEAEVEQEPQLLKNDNLSVTGVVVSRGNAYNKETVNMESLSDGIYFVTIKANGESNTVKIIKK